MSTFKGILGAAVTDDAITMRGTFHQWNQAAPYPGRVQFRINWTLGRSAGQYYPALFIIYVNFRHEEGTRYGPFTWGTATELIPHLSSSGRIDNTQYTQADGKAGDEYLRVSAADMGRLRVWLDLQLERGVTT